MCQFKFDFEAVALELVNDNLLLIELQKLLWYILAKMYIIPGCPRANQAGTIIRGRRRMFLEKAGQLSSKELLGYSLAFRN